MILDILGHFKAVHPLLSPHTVAPVIETADLTESIVHRCSIRFKSIPGKVHTNCLKVEADESYVVNCLLTLLLFCPPFHLIFD